MPFAESHNGARADSVVGFLRFGEPVFSKGNLPMVRIFDLKHELRLMDAPDDDFSLVFRKPLAGVYGIFQGVGKADAQLGGVDGQRFRKGKPFLHGNAGTLRTAEIGRERGIQDWIVTIPGRCGMDALRGCFLYVIKNRPGISFLCKHGNIR